jgi:hypothetical protein
MPPKRHSLYTHFACSPRTAIAKARLRSAREFTNPSTEKSVHPQKSTASPLVILVFLCTIDSMNSGEQLDGSPRREGDQRPPAGAASQASARVTRRHLERHQRLCGICRHPERAAIATPGSRETGNSTRHIADSCKSSTRMESARSAILTAPDLQRNSGLFVRIAGRNRGPGIEGDRSGISCYSSREPLLCKAVSSFSYLRRT